MVMYQEHFGLIRAPFSMHPDPAFLYLSDQHSSAKAFLESSALVNDSFVVITGSIGAGKTTLVEGFLSELPAQSTVIARINQTQLSATGFLRLLLNDLGLKAFKSKKPQLLARLGDFLGACEREGKSVVIVVDEAQNLSRDVLEEIRLLTGSKHAACLSVVLVGQPEFLEILESPNLRQLAQRCRLRSHLASLDEVETSAYIQHRLAIAGSEASEVFTEEAIAAIYSHTGGVPRLINNLCDTALICAFADELDQVDENVVNAALSELKWQPRGPQNPDRPHSPKPQRLSAENKRELADLSRQLAEKTALLEEQDNQVRQLSHELEAAQAEAREHDEKLRDANAELARAGKLGDSDKTRQQGLAKSENRLSELQARIESCLEAVEGNPDDENEAATASLLDDFSAVEARLEETDALLDEINSAGKRSSEAADSKETEIEQLRSDLESHKAQLDEREEELKALKESAALSEKIEENLSAANSEVEQLRGDLESRQEQMEALEEELKGLRETAAWSETLEQNLAAADSGAEKLREEIERLVAASQESGQKLSEQADQASKIEAELAEAAKTTTDMEAEKASLTSQLEQALADLEQSGSRIAEQDDALQQFKEEKLSLESTNTKLDEDLASTQAKLKSTEEKLAELQTEHDTAISKIERQEQRVDSRDHSIRTLEAEVRRKNKLIDEMHDKMQPLPELTSQVEIFSAENSELKNELESRIHRIAELEEALSLSQQRLDDARHEIDSSHEQHVGLHKEVAEYKSQVAELEKGTSKRDDLVKSLHVECDNRKQDLRRLRSELDEALDQARELRDSAAVGEDRVRELETELQAALETIREMNESGHEANAEAREINDELTTRNQQIEELQSALEQKDATLASMESTLKEKTETIKVLELDADATSENLKAQESAVDAETHEQLVKQLRREVAARDRCIDELEASLATSSESVVKLTARIEKQDAKVSELEEQLESSRLAAAELREEMGRADREFEQTAVIQDESSADTSKSLQLQTLGAGLLVSASGHAARRVPLRSERIIIGRTRDSDIKIDNEFASRHHAQIVYDDGRFFVEDLNSTNGIFVNSRRVKRRRLRNRDIISIGRDRLIFMLEQHTSH